MNISVVQADASHLECLAPLFDAYRQFYGQPADDTGAREFLSARLTGGDSTIFVAFSDGDGVGFTQIFPSFSSVAMQRIWILNDLFVSPTVRRHGVGLRLLDAATDFARSTSAWRLVLATAIRNHEAQSLYKKYGWRLDEDFDHYFFPLNGG